MATVYDVSNVGRVTDAGGMKEVAAGPVSRQSSTVYYALEENQNRFKRWSCQWISHEVFKFISPSGSLSRYFNGRNLRISVVDNCVNTMTLVNALILTIPYGVITALNSEFWDSLKVSMEEGNCDTYYHYYYFRLRDNILIVIYSGITSIAVSVFYYILRPDFEAREGTDLVSRSVLETLQATLEFHRTGVAVSETVVEARSKIEHAEEDAAEEERFRIWWRSGRVVLLVVFSLTTCAVISLLILTYLLFSVFAVPSDEICEFGNTAASSMSIAFGSLLLFYSIYCLL
jgi:hypothetical protein